MPTGSKDEDTLSNECKILGGLFAAVVQVLLCAVCVGTLIVKRQMEVPKREWYVWFLDASKQGVGSSIGHFSNMFLSIALSKSLNLKGNECEWYSLAYIVDASIGTFFNFSLLYLYENFVYKSLLPCCAIKSFGDYGSPPSLRHWWPQLLVWIVIIVLSKAVILSILVVLAEPFDELVVAAFVAFSSSPKAELILVMIFIPCLVNALQFWVTDSWIKKHAPQRVSSDTHMPLGQHDLDEELLASSSSSSLSSSSNSFINPFAPPSSRLLFRSASGERGGGSSRSEKTKSTTWFDQLQSSLFSSSKRREKSMAMMNSAMSNKKREVELGSLNNLAGSDEMNE